MPPEPSPWDRRKHDISGLSDRNFTSGNFSAGGSQRWRDQNHHPYAPPPNYHHRHQQQQQQQQQQRWCSDFRSSRPFTPGHGKQGGWNMYSEEAGNGYLPFGSRYGDRNNNNFEDDNNNNSRSPFVSRGSDGRYFRNSRENRVWRGPSWEPTASPIGAGAGGGRLVTEINNRRSVERTPAPYNNMSTKDTDFSHRSEFASPLPRSQNPSPFRCVLKEQLRKEGGTAEECNSVSQKVEKENEPVSIDWKPLKWNRTGSLSSRSSGFSHSISPKGMGVESVETVAAVQTKSLKTLQSPSADVGVGVVAGGSAPLDDASARKKPRLGWGQGLAKFEKKKVDGPEDCVVKDGEVARVDNTETLQSHAVDFVDKSPRVVCLPECASPATPSSVACSSSTGAEEKESVKSVNINNDMIQLTCSPITVSQALYSGPTFNLENLEPSSIANLRTLINDMLHSCGSSSTDSGYMQSSMLNKLSVLKVDISKAIEVTESEIDSLETELKLLIAESTNSPYSASSSSLLEVCHSNPCEDQATTSKVNGEEVNDFTPELNPVNSSQDLATGSSTCSDVNDHCSIIWASNKDCADRAMKELYKVLVPSNKNQFDISMTTSVSLLNGDLLTVKEKFVMRKRFLQLKEKVLSLKFKVFRHFWKEGRVLSVRNLRLKSHEKYDLSGYRKNRTVRPRISFFSGTPETVPADEVIEVVNNMLSTMPLKPCRNTLKMPSLILDKKEMKMSRFPSNNGLIIDPRGAEKERSTINPWTSEETDIFIDNLTTFGKNFKKISSFLEHKTIAECIEFYYKNHKSQVFERARKKKPDSTKQRKPQSTTYLVASAKRWNRETKAASLDILGEASAIAANVDVRAEIHQKRTSRLFLSPSSSSYKSQKGEDSERETVAADVLAGICGSISSEAMSSCITSSLDHGEVQYQDWKYRRVGSLKKRPLAPEVTESIDDECSDDSCGEMAPTIWKGVEKSSFIQAVSSYGNDFLMISQSVGTRSREDCKNYFFRAKKRFGLDFQPESIGSDTQDAFDTGTGSVVCKEATGTSKPTTKICEVNNRPNEIVSMATEAVICDSTVCHREMDKVASDLNTKDTEQNVESSSGEANKRDSEGGGMEEREGNVILLSDNVKVKKVVDVNSSEVSAVSGSANEMKSDDLCVSHHFVANTSIRSGGKVSECQKKAYHEQISQVLPSVNSSKLFSVPIKYQTSPPHNSLSASGNNNLICYNRRPLNIVDANDSQTSHSVSDSAKTLQIFRGHPVSMQTNKQINGDLNYERPIHLQNVPKQNGISHSDRFSLQKCNSLDQSRPLASASSDADRPHRNGDVKLFGKILKASQPKAKCSETQGDQLCRSRDVNFNGDCKVTGSDNVPVRSCSFWDGNMVQGGFPQLPDSGLLLNKYPAAFGKCALKLDHPSTPNSSSGVAEYQVLRNGDTQPFSVDMNQKQDVLFSEMSRRLGFDVISGLKHQAGGLNVVGMGGGVSDPVAAIKMHYANAEQFSLHSGSILNEDNSWRSKGDLGSR